MLEPPPDAPPEGQLDELPLEPPEEPPLPELPPDEDGGAGMDVEDDCSSMQPPMRNAAAAATAKSRPNEEARHLPISLRMVTPSFHLSRLRSARSRLCQAPPERAL